MRGKAERDRAACSSCYFLRFRRGATGWTVCHDGARRIKGSDTSALSFIGQLVQAAPRSERNGFSTLWCIQRAKEV